MFDEKTFPSFLFQNENVDNSDNSLDYLVDKQTLKDFVFGLCKKLHHPFLLLDYKALIKKDISEKSELVAELFPARRACSILRKCAGDKYCTECERFYAKCIDIDKATIEKRIEESINQVPSFFCPVYRDYPPKILEVFNRPVIEYRCPILGYRELLFPLMYEKVIYGVLITGQLMVCDGEDYEINRIIRDSFFKKTRSDVLFKEFINVFNTYNDDINKQDCEMIKTMIQVSDDETRLYDQILDFKFMTHKDSSYFSGNFGTYDEYRVFINSVCSAIDEGEDAISEAYEDRKKTIVSNIVEQIAFKHYKEYWEVNQDYYHKNYKDELKRAWKGLKAFVKDILHQFVFVEKVILFADSKDGSDIMTDFLLVTKDEEKREGAFCFSMDGIDRTREFMDSLRDPEILNGLSKNLSKENSIIICCHDITMLISVRDLKAHKKLYISLADAIGKELVRINNIIALCFEKMAREEYRGLLSHFWHDNSHTSGHLMDYINRYFGNSGERFLDAEIKERQLIFNDLKKNIQHYNLLNNNLGVLLGTAIVLGATHYHVGTFDMTEMLRKLKNEYQGALKYKNLDVIVCWNGYDSSSYENKDKEYLAKRASEIARKNGIYASAPSILDINTVLFELIIYNMVQRALDYAYIGSNIYFIWGERENEYELSIISYGCHLPERDFGDGLYVPGDEWFFRESKELYIIDLISKRLNLKVGHHCKKISDYNIPLISWYEKTDFTEFSDYSKIEMQTLIHDQNPEQTRLVINDNPSSRIDENDISPIYLRMNIEKETWKTTFFLNIPIKKHS